VFLLSASFALAFFFSFRTISQLFMDSYADYAERAKLMTNVHAKRKGGAFSESGAGKGSEAAAAASTKLDGAAEDVGALGSG